MDKNAVGVGLLALITFKHSVKMLDFFFYFNQTCTSLLEQLFFFLLLSGLKMPLKNKQTKNNRKINE